jgi:hypothetical protein
MAAPKLTITRSNGNLGQSLQTSDGIAGLIMSGESVTDKIQVDTPRLYTSLEAAEEDGITSAGVNAFAWKQIKQFYDEAGDGSELYVLITTVAVDFAANKANPQTTSLLDYANGKIRLLAYSFEVPGAPGVTDGLMNNIHVAVPLAQEIAEEYAEKYQPVSVVLFDGTAYSGIPGDLKDYTAEAYNRCAIILSGEEDQGNGDVGSALGRLSRVGVQRKMSATADGPLEGIDAAYLKDTTVENRMNYLDTFHDRGYIIHRKWEGLPGYYFSSSRTLTADTDDFATITNNRVMDKAILIGQAELVTRMESDFLVDKNGNMSLSEVKSWQGAIQKAIEDAMVPDEMSSVTVKVNGSQVVTPGSEIKVTVSGQPRGYAGTISGEFGFTATTA